jgi:hypothetical protein
MELLGDGALTVVMCLVGLLLLGGLVGLVVFLVKLGVIGSYWLKGEEQSPADESGDYRLEHSREL